MRRRDRLYGGLGALTLAAAALAFTPVPGPDEGPADAAEAEAGTSGADAPATSWRIRATGPRIIGGYGHNFAYDGSNVRPLEGHAVARIDPEAGTGRVEIEVSTTPASGPIHFSDGTRWEGTVRIVQRLNTEQMDAARIAQDVFLHGDTGNEAPVMPKIYNYFATWGPSTITVNGEEAVPMIGSHTMFTEQARGADGKIDRNGEVYSPRKADKTGFTDPGELEFHYVAHTTEPDQDNFPPHTGWIHLHFSEVEVIRKPDGIEIPYRSSDRR